VPDQVVVPIEADSDLVAARQSGRSLAEELGFSSTEQTLIATAISEVARNIVQYARRGTIRITAVHEGNRSGIEVIAEDSGPGIEDLDMAMQAGYTSGRGMGLGLPGARRLMEEFDIRSEPGAGTTIVMRKWVRGRG
jgi:serine/threonine-protein kinase RsbT